MAVNIMENQDEEQKKAQAAAPAIGQQQQQPQQAVTGVTAGSAQQPQQAQQKQNRTGSGFVNVQNILAANKQNRMGQVITGGVTNVAQGVKTGLQQQQKEFQEHAAKNALGTEADRARRQQVIDKVTAAPAPVQSYEDWSSTAATSYNPAIERAKKEGTYDPNKEYTQTVNMYTPEELKAQYDEYVKGVQTQPLISDEDIAQFQTFRAGEYKGPESLRDEQLLQDQARRAEQLGQSLRNEGGRQDLLRQFVGRKTGYGQGMSALDATILGQTAGNTLKHARQQTFGLTGKVGQAAETASQIGEANKLSAQAFGQETNKILGGKGQEGLIGEMIGSIESDVAARNLKAQQNLEGLQTRLANKQLTVDDVEKYIKPLISNGYISTETDLFGLTPEDLSKALSQQQFGVENVVDQARANKLNALQRLADRQDLTLDQSKIGQQLGDIAVDPSQFEEFREKQRQLEGSTDSLKRRTVEQEKTLSELGRYEVGKMADQMSKFDVKNYTRQVGVGRGVSTTEIDYDRRAKDVQRFIDSELSNKNLPEGVRASLLAAKAKIDNEIKKNLSNQRTSGPFGQPKIDTDVLGGKSLLDLFKEPVIGTKEKLSKDVENIKKNYGAGGSILDLMGDAEREKFENANISDADKLRKKYGLQGEREAFRNLKKALRR